MSNWYILWLDKITKKKKPVIISHFGITIIINYDKQKWGSKIKPSIIRTLAIFFNKVDEAHLGIAYNSKVLTRPRKECIDIVWYT